MVDISPFLNIEAAFFRLTLSPSGSVAQLVEQWTENPCVAGSIPTRATFLFTHLTAFLLFIIYLSPITFTVY